MTQVLSGAFGPPKRVARPPLPSSVDRVREEAHRLGCPDVWARSAGRHVIVGIGANEAFARFTPVGPGVFGLAFRETSEASGDVGAPCASRWQRLLLIDELTHVVEHALIGEGALPRRAARM